ncbi:MAG: hypothetical protein Q4E61_04525 [Alphaproteobacteria bacterium]|nr:hypothetical protein [Alphaproteobacteria bacterium]
MKNTIHEWDERNQQDLKNAYKSIKIYSITSAITFWLILSGIAIYKLGLLGLIVLLAPLLAISILFIICLPLSDSDDTYASNHLNDFYND